MSVLTNPADGAKEDAEAYIAAVLDLLQNEEPLKVLAETPHKIADLISVLSAASLNRPEQPGKWSIREVIQHLADSELVWSYRLRMVLAEDRPTLTGYDQDRWAKRLQYSEADVTFSLAIFRMLRQANLRLLERMDSSDLDRVAVHAERGDESVRHMIQLCAGHDLAHLNQIKRIMNWEPG